MTVGKAIYYLLNNSTDLEAVVGTRIFPEVAEQDSALPFVMYSVISNEPSDTHSGPSLLDVAQVDVIAYNTSYSGCIDMGVYVRAALDRVTGTYNGVNVQSCQYNSEVIDFDEYKRAYVITQSYDVRISRTEFEIAQGTPVTGAQLGDLYDVTDDATTGQVIVKQADGTWAGGDAAGALGDLTDVASDVTSEAIDRHALVYDEDSGEWITRYPGEIRIYNDSDETIVKGRCVTAIGAQGDMVTVRPYITTDDTRYVVGVATEEMAVGASGHAITIGEVRGLDTEGFAVGTILQPTNFVNSVRPFGMGPATAGAGQPDRPLPIAMVTRSHANTGRIQVRMFTPGYYHQIAAMSDVYVPFPYQGAVLKYIVSGGTAFWGYLPQTSKIIADGAEEDVEIYYYAESDDTQLAITQRSDTPSAGNKIVRKIWYTTASQADPDADVWTLYQTLDDNATFAELQTAFEASLLVSPTGGQPVSIKTTWDDIPAFSGLLDTYPGAAAAYSLRLLDSTYTGDAINVRRASDNAVQDIGFDANGDLDTSALATFCAGTDGYVVRWYDQSGNGNDAVQATTSAQPQIVASGSVLTENGKAALRFDGSDDLFNTSWSAGDTSAFSSFNIASPTNNTTSSNLYDLRDANDDGLRLFMFSDGNLFFSADADDLRTTAYLSGQQLVYANYNNSAIFTAIDGNSTDTTTAPASTSVTANAYLFATNIGSAPFNGKAQEAIFYTSDQSANRAGIETNINDYYTIY
jgi:hypothetical protein